MQEVVPFVLVQPLRQAPQCLMSVSVLVSQPLSGLPSQSLYPASHVGEHRPNAQEVVPLALVQEFPHEPQLSTSPPMKVTQPLSGSPSQSPQPGSQSGLQTPAEQKVAPLGLVQTLPQVLQLVTSVSRSTQLVPQQANGGVQSEPMPPHRHWPSVQISLGSHQVSQSPQCRFCTKGSKHSFPQQISSAVQSGPSPPQVHDPRAHSSLAWQATSHEPQ